MESRDSISTLLVVAVTNTMGDEDLTWLFDAVLGFLKSPGWALPVMSFIDDNCIVFDSGALRRGRHLRRSP